jgi:hypothetical protein
MLVCFFILHARLRVRLAPGIPCSLFSPRGTLFSQSSGASRREKVKACRFLLWLILRDGARAPLQNEVALVA